MGLYFYEAFSQAGKKVSGYTEAPSVAHVKEQLVKQQLFPVKIHTATQQSKTSFYSFLFGKKVRVSDIILFTRQLVVLLKAGIPLLQALELLIDYFEGALKTIVINLKDDIKEGKSFADALQQYPKIFSTIYIQLVRAGEASGNLEVLLERLTQYLEKQEVIKKKIQTAFRYPAIQAGVAFMVVTFLLYYIVPQMAENFASQEKALPGATQFLVNLSNALTHHILFILTSLTTLVTLFTYWKNTAQGAQIIDRVKLNLPLVKYFARTNAIVQFSYTLGMLIEGGVNLTESLDIVCKIVDNRILAKALEEARDKIIKQGKIAQY
ncbi:MAG: type II secretion system F family protein, partial [Candidatus Babeliales bacterium]